MNSREFIHPEDEAAMRNLEGVPGAASPSPETSAPPAV